MHDLLKHEIKYADLMKCVIGQRAHVYVVAHPAAPQRSWLFTSPVVRMLQHTPNGPVFETLNSIYRPEETDETLPKASVKRASA